MPSRVITATDEDSTHIVGPVETSDTRVLADYLSADPGRLRRVNGDLKPVLFTSVRKRPLGMSMAQSVSALKCQVVEKILEPWVDDVVALYFAKVNGCFPLLEESSFRALHRDDRARLSPALLAVLYASSLVHWKASPVLAPQACPDIRFIWNQANEALYSELYLAPGLATIIAFLLNMGGRPTTSLIGNAAQLGCAVSLAHSLGLNRDPTHWDMPPEEKRFRMRLWWGLLIYDKWCSLSYGTPAHIRRAQYDVPPPQIDHFWVTGMTHADRARSAIFATLVTLSEVLGTGLDHVYDLHTTPEQLVHIPAQLEAALSGWEQTLPLLSLHGDDGTDSRGGPDDDLLRCIVLHGTHLHHPGAANLRLSYLAVRLLHRRIELDVVKTGVDATASASAAHLHVRQVAEDIVRLAQQLEPAQLADFWLSTSAFVFASTATVLLRCALEEVEEAAANTAAPPRIPLAHTTSVGLAVALLDCLRAHRASADWDLADVCLAQYTGVMERLLAGAGAGAAEEEGHGQGGDQGNGNGNGNGNGGVDDGGGLGADAGYGDSAHTQMRQQGMLDVPDLDELFPSLWEFFD